MFLGQAACDGTNGGAATEDPPAPSAHVLSTLSRDLTLGSSGEDVRAVTAYLTAYGYFPNERLGQAYPMWRPLVAAAPADAAVVDTHTIEAVRQFQANSGLPVTGVVDADTRALLALPRCGVPDGMPHFDLADKFALQGSSWNQSLTWRLLNTDDVTMTQARTAIGNAVASWVAQTTLSVSEITTGTADIQISFGTIDGPGNILARTFYPQFGGDMTIDTAETWSVAATTPVGAFDLETTVLHELGHAFGLLHSSAVGATMRPTYAGADHTLSTDDTVAISAIYDTYVQLPGIARDIAIGAGGAVWVIGTAAFGDGTRAYRWNGSDWDATDGGGARVAIDGSGFPWIVGASGTIYRRSTSASVNTGTWSVLPGLAKDIGAGADGSVWIIGTNPVPGGFGIYKWNGGGWDAADGGAVKITVGPDGVPWVLNSSNAFFRRTTNSPFTGSWQTLPGISTDLAINTGNYLWSVGPLNSGQANISVWDEQSALGTAPAVSQWTPGKRMGAGGPNEAIAVTPSGSPWLVDNNGAIFRASR